MMMWENLTQEDDIMKKISIHWSTVFIMLGILVSFFAFLNGMDLFQSVKAALNEASEFRYKNEITVNISGYSQNADMIKNQLTLKLRSKLSSKTRIHIGAPRSATSCTAKHRKNKLKSTQNTMKFLNLLRKFSGMNLLDILF